MAGKNDRVVAVLGASPKPERYSNRAVATLKAQGYPVYPVHPAKPVVHGFACLGSLSEIRSFVDTLTLYVNPGISDSLEREILALKPRRVIFNPGSENPRLEEALRRNGMEIIEACTLVMLNTGQF